MPGRVFIDSNVWIYAKIQAQDLRKHQQARSLLEQVRDEVVISTQVLAEFANVCIKFGVPEPTVEDGVTFLARRVTVQLVTKETILSALRLRTSYGYSFFDSMILATALAAECETLFTEDLQDGQRIEKTLIIRNPFS